MSEPTTSGTAGSESAESTGSATAASGPILRRELNLRSLITIGVCLMFPLAPTAVYGAVTLESGGHMALAYLFAAIPMSFTAWSYGQMASVHPVAGSAYSYARRTVSPEAGFVTGWAVLLDYLFFQVLNYIMIGIFATSLFPSLPTWGVVIVAAVIVTGINLTGIKNLDRVNTVLVIAMFVTVAYFIVAAIATTASDPALSFSTKALYNPETFNMSLVLAGTSIACFSFLGFDALTTLSEETKDPRRVMSKATVTVIAIMAVVFIAQAWAAQTVFPDNSKLTNPDAAFFDVAFAAGGATLANTISIAVIAGALANALDTQAGVSRLLYGMGRDGVLPRSFFGKLAANDVPRNNILLMGAVGLVGAALPLATVLNLINFGALIAFMAVNLCVILWFWVKKLPSDVPASWKHLVLPGLGFVTCALLMWSLSGDAKLMGLGWLAIGVLVMVITGAARKADLSGR